MGTKRNRKSKRNMETFRVIEEAKGDRTIYRVQFKHRFLYFFTYWRWAKGLTVGIIYKKTFSTQESAIECATREMRNATEETTRKVVYAHGYRMPEYRTPPPAPEKPVTA